MTSSSTNREVARNTGGGGLDCSAEGAGVDAELPESCAPAQAGSASAVAHTNSRKTQIPIRFLMLSSGDILATGCGNPTDEQTLRVDCNTALLPSARCSRGPRAVLISFLEGGW